MLIRVETEGEQVAMKKLGIISASMLYILSSSDDATLSLRPPFSSGNSIVAPVAIGLAPRDSGSMNKDVEAPCQVCGGLLPLKAIQTSRRGRHRQSCSLHPKQNIKPGRPKVENSGGKASHRPQTEQGSTSQSKGTRESRRSPPLSSNSDGQTEVTSSRNRLNYELGEQFQAAKPSVLEQFQETFACQKANKEAVRCGIHGDQEHTERKPNNPIEQVQSQARQHPVSQHGSVVKSKQKKTLSPEDIDLPCLLHQDQGKIHNESSCTRIVGYLPQDNASNCSSNPSVSTSHCKIHVATQSCNHLLADSKHGRRGKMQGEATAASSSQSGGAAMKKCNRAHGAVDQHHDECRSRAISPAESYPDVIRLYEECHLHQVEEHIIASQRSSSRDSRKFQRCGNYPEQGLHTQPQIILSCHQRVRHQSVVQHHKVCHLHRDDDHEFAAQSPISRDSTKPCERCGSPQPARNELSLQGHADRKASHQSSKAYVKTESLCAQVITPRSGVLSPCSLHGDCGSEKIDSCGVCWHPKKDHIANVERKSPDDQKIPRRGKIQGCRLHRESPSSPKRQEPKDPLIWTPRRVQKPRPCSSVRWLDRIIASQNIPPQIIREFLQGRRGWPPQAMKQKCLGCMKRLSDENESPRDPCPREFDVTSWNPGSSVAQSTGECKEQYDGKLSRLLMARTSIIKPVVKLSTSKEIWRSRKELKFCSECWNPTRFGRWASILDEMSKDVHEVADMSRCDMKFSSHTVHGNPNPCDAREVNLHRPELFSTFRLRSMMQKLQNETFDKSTALQVAQKKSIKLDKKVLAQFPEKNKPPRVDRARQESPSLRRCHDTIAQKRQEPYVGLSIIVQSPNPICRVQRAPRKVGVQANRPKPPPKPSESGSAKDFCPEKVHSQVQAMPCTANPINRAEQEHSLEEQHWAQVVEACKQVHSMKAVCDSRLHDLH